MVDIQFPEYEINFYRYTLYDKENKIYLLTLDCGDHIFLKKDEFQQLRINKITSKTLYEKLYKKCFLIDKNNFNDIVKKTHERYKFLHNGTSLHIVIPTSRCNLNCSYCFADPKSINDTSTGNDLDEKTAKKIIEFAISSPGFAKTIEFTGGEATARFDTVKIMVEHAKKINKKFKKDLRLTIVSNLLLFNEEIMEYLIQNDVQICTSLDGPKEIHDKNRIIHIREGKEVGTYDRVIFWIKKINQRCDELNKSWRCSALMTITKYSLPMYKEIIDEFIDIGSDIIELRALTKVGKAAKSDDPFNYSLDEFTDFYKKSLKYLEELEKKGVKVGERAKLMYQQKVLEQTPTYHTDFESPCGAATGQIVYHSNGDIYTCHEALGRDEFKLGNVFKSTWETMFQSKEVSSAILNSMLENNVKCDRCVFKPYCGTCMVENFYEFDKFNFYPTKTTKHHETIMQCKTIFDDLLKKEKL